MRGSVGGPLDCPRAARRSSLFFSPSCSSIVTHHSPRFFRPGRRFEGYATLVTALSPFLLLTRHLPLVTAFKIGSPSQSALPITDAGECGRPHGLSKGCAPLVVILRPFLPSLFTRHCSSASLVTVLQPFLLVTRHSSLVTVLERPSSLFFSLSCLSVVTLHSSLFLSVTRQCSSAVRAPNAACGEHDQRQYSLLKRRPALCARTCPVW